MAAPRTARPFIGINADLVTPAKTAPVARVGIGYADAVTLAGGMPVILPPYAKDVELDALLDRLDGVVFTGGLDLYPRRVGQATHPAVVPMPERREVNDRRLIQAVIDRRMPLLAIGVGMQLLNVTCGGSLFLHLPEENPKALPHFDPSGYPHRHTVNLETNTRIDEIYGGGELRVNSGHHQAVKTLAPRMRVGALAPDGVIEAIESTDPNWFCVGVQWHPECDTASALDRQIFDCLVQAAVRYAEPALASV
jgi:putative glutamine amidotransferase